ncbi:ribosome-recycling factor, mitochondrial-like isoform X1 [Acropora millepora]|uniref:ribosome-recycling factor, mitochondrial-like isoform X1 n=1 Tax=Acropora millepora TaxID=45264 RepID=UPI001CF0DD51|nr:ribosome-recycling factor, mitochondrial-like isoform X1 [Acropora millepora]
MNLPLVSRFSPIFGMGITRTTYSRLAVARFYASKKGKKAKSSTISIDNDLAVGLVDLAKLKTSMESTVSRLQLDFRDKLSTKVQPNALDKVRLESQNGNEKFTLSQVAQIKMKDGMFIVDMASSPELVSQAAKAIKSWSENFEPTMDGHVISIPIPRITQEYRENLSKTAKATCEQAKQSIRKIRQKGMSDVKKNKKGRSDDDVRLVEKMIQQITDEYCGDTDVLLAEKTKELLRK